MASERRVVSQQLCRALELNWQFVILIALTPLHPGKSIISQGKAQRKSTHRHCLFPLFFSVFPAISSSTYFLVSLAAWMLFSRTLLHSLHFTLFYTYGFVLQHTDILLGRDFHYLRSGTIYQGMCFSHLLWLTVDLSLDWILHSAIPFFHHSRLKLDWWQVWADVHTIVHVLLLAPIALWLPLFSAMTKVQIIDFFQV